jgi:hypothetical protein
MPHRAAELTLHRAADLMPHRAAELTLHRGGTTPDRAAETDAAPLPFTDAESEWRKVLCDIA